MAVHFVAIIIITIIWILSLLLGIIALVAVHGRAELQNVLSVPQHFGFHVFEVFILAARLEKPEIFSEIQVKIAVEVDALFEEVRDSAQLDVVSGI